MECDPLEIDLCAEGSVAIRMLGPWPGPRFHYQQEFNSQFKKLNGRLVSIPGGRVMANKTSAALLVQYGSAQVLLGGDMENESWEQLEEALTTGRGPALNPTVIKVSHHGSSTASRPGMWMPDQGFYGNRPATALAVVTPWRRGSEKRRLPDANVLKDISDSGYQTWVTGLPVGVRKGDTALNYPEAFVHIEVSADGSATVIDSKDSSLFGAR